MLFLFLCAFLIVYMILSKCCLTQDRLIMFLWHIQRTLIKSFASCVYLVPLISQWSSSLKASKRHEAQDRLSFFLYRQKVKRCVSVDKADWIWKETPVILWGIMLYSNWYNRIWLVKKNYRFFFNNFVSNFVVEKVRLVMICILAGQRGKMRTSSLNFFRFLSIVSMRKWQTSLETFKWFRNIKHLLWCRIL